MMAIVILIAKMMALANQKEVEVAWDEHHDVDNNDDDDDGDDGDDDDDDDDDGDDDDDDDDWVEACTHHPSMNAL